MLKREQLHEYQTRMINRLASQPINYLAIQMGMGKSVTTLTAISDALKIKKPFKTLVVAPKRVALSTWHTEIETWEHLNHLTYSIVAGKTLPNRKKALAADADIYIINRENIPWIVDFYGSDFPFKWLVIDEASSFKSHSSKRFKKLRTVRNLVSNVTLLSGTPSPQGLHDLWSQIFLLDNGKRLGKTVTAFRNRWFKTDYMGYSYEPQPFAQSQIEHAVSDVMVSMKSVDYLELPKLNNITVKVELDAKTLKYYKELRDTMMIDFTDSDSEITATEAAVVAGKMLQMANGAIYDDDRNVIHLHDAKIDALKEIVEDNPGEQFLVAYNFKHDLSRLKKAFPFAKTIEDNSTIKDWNNSKIKMLLAHPMSCGHGLNLQKNPKGNTAIWFGLNWSLELRQQMDARLYRQGKTKPVTIIDIVADGTIDERVQQALKDKCSVQDALMYAIKA